MILLIYYYYYLILVYIVVLAHSQTYRFCSDWWLGPLAVRGWSSCTGFWIINLDHSAHVRVSKTCGPQGAMVFKPFHFGVFLTFPRDQNFPYLPVFHRAGAGVVSSQLDGRIFTISPVEQRTHTTTTTTTTTATATVFRSRMFTQTPLRTSTNGQNRFGTGLGSRFRSRTDPIGSSLQTSREIFKPLRHDEYRCLRSPYTRATPLENQSASKISLTMAPIMDFCLNQQHFNVQFNWLKVVILNKNSF